MKNDHDFSKGSIASNILALAGPMTLAQIINLLYNIIDRIYIGRLVSATALTGLGVCFPILTMVTAFSNLVGMGGTPLFSIERGKGDYEMAEKIMGNCVTMLLLLAFSLTLLFLLVKKPVLYMFGASDTTFIYADAYLSIYLLGTVFVLLTLGLNNFINAQGFARTAMMTTVIGCICNILLDPFLIYVLKLGVRGAAIATIISQGISCAWILRFLTSQKALITIKKEAMRLDWRLDGRIVMLGSSGFVMAFTNSAVQAACNATLQQFGGGSDIYITVMTVINSVREIFQLPAQGLTNGAQPVISFNYGANQYDRVLDAIRFMTITTFVYMTVAWMLVLVFGEYFIRIFNSEQAVIKAALPCLKAYFFGFFFMALQFAGQSTFVALGRSKHAVFFSIFRKLIIVVPLTLLLPRIGFGVMGVFYAEPISNAVGGMASFGTMLLTVGKQLRESIVE